jgi:glutamate formiminotransferase/formiminotetrahydrofolate cyclodeaminase
MEGSMAQKMVECVPNFSEGRDVAKIKAITDAMESVAGTRLLDVDPGADTNRTVVTIVGDPESVLEAAFKGIKKASEVIDMRGHSGSHPRMGACDVCPFVPVEGVSMEDCAELAKRLGAKVGQELQIPVYLYEAAASRPERKNLAVVRKGEYEGLEKKLKDPNWVPDFGPATFVPTFGALITGAREFLIAYNVTLNSRDKAHATDIAFELREKGRVARRGQTTAFYSSGKELRYAEGFFPCGNCPKDFANFESLEAHCRDEHGYELKTVLELNDIDSSRSLVGQKAYKAGLFKCCKAIGWYVDAYKRVQLSINLTDYKTTSMVDVLEAARKMAADRGLVVTGSEIVGLVPFKPLFDAGQYYLRGMGKSPFVPAQDVLECAIFSMGLSDVAPFEIDKKVLGLPKSYPNGLMSMAAKDLVTEVSRDTPAPGGGSIAALAGALGAALASMVANLTKAKDDAHLSHLSDAAEMAHRTKDALVLAVDEDTSAFNAYMDARRMPQATAAEKAAKEAAMLDGLKTAANVPFQTASLSFEAMKAAAIVVEYGNPASMTDGLVGAQMGFAGVRGGIWNVLINLKDIHDAAFKDEMKRRCESLLSEATALLGKVVSAGDTRLGATLK